MKTKLTKGQYRLYALWALSLAAAFGIGFFLSGMTRGDASAYSIREYDKRYEFIRPLLICQANEEEDEAVLKPLESAARKVIDRATAAGQITSGSVYYRDLNSGRWMGVNELEPHSPGSLLKVPLMMAYFKEAEKDPQALQRRYRFTRPAEDVDPLTPNRFLQSGQTYTAEELIRGMITQSDNSAKDVLTEHADAELLKETYAALELTDPYGNDDESYKISPKQYSLFFRVLYNGTFLDREMSNRALGLLAQSEFNLGLRAGIPKGVTVAHKYGVKSVTEDGAAAVELSDCGIVYSASPYMICIMVEGKEPFILAEIIRQIAEATYQPTATRN